MKIGFDTDENEPSKGVFTYFLLSHISKCICALRHLLCLSSCGALLKSSMYHISHLRKPQLRKTVEKECVSIGCICISVKQFLRARVSSVCLAFENAASFRICDQLSSHSCSPSATSVRAAVFRVTTFLERHSRIPDRRVEA